MRISDWSSDVCSSDLAAARKPERAAVERDEIFVHHVIVQREEGLAVIDLGGSRGIEIGVGSELAADEADHPVGKRTERRCRIVEALLKGVGVDRSDERRVGKESVSTCRSRCWPYH